MNALMSEIQVELDLIRADVIKGNVENALEGLRILRAYVESRKTAAPAAKVLEELVGV